jgi:hypothetical protein
LELNRAAQSRQETKYHHVKKLMYTVRVDEPDPRFGHMLLEQFGGANGELATAMQYSIQGINCEDPALNGLGKHSLSIGQIPPTKDVVGQCFNNSTGRGDMGEDLRGGKSR